ncbi:MAG: trypsin-like peptidase domain-containing protein [Clostridia bacterium]|nr:trypsin-like peptidase domain-containing protein [Clostridia bacterium]
MNNNYDNENLKNMNNGEGVTDNDNKASQDIEESKKESDQVGQSKEEVIAEKGEDTASKEKAVAEEAKTTAEEEKASGEKWQADQSQGGTDRTGGERGSVNNTPRYTANYTPPYYVPNFTVATGAAPKVKKEKKKVGVVFVAVLCAVCILFTVAAFAFIGLLIYDGSFFGVSDGSGYNGEEINIIKSDREITVSEFPGNMGYTDLTVAQVAALVGESVVEITTTHVQIGQYITSGAGSGVIFDQTEKYGYIVTNYHVVVGASDISVRVKDGDSYKDYKATYIAGDEAEDIAVISIPVESNEKFTLAVFADSDKIQVGEEVVAIGNPLGKLGGTVTNGIISALDREIIIEDNTMTLLQTNAAINPGNSGGGLFNMAGELVGIVNAKQSSTGIEGLGFAIPSNKVADDIEELLELGYISGRATLGITVQYGSPGIWYPNGLYVVDTVNSDFKKYDQIVAINNVKVSSLSEYNAAVKNLKIGDSVTVKVVRNNSYVDITVTVTENTAKT